MLILVILGMYDSMYFDAVVVFVTSQTNLFRLALAILCYRWAVRKFQKQIFLFTILPKNERKYSALVARALLCTNLVRFLEELRPR